MRNGFSNFVGLASKYFVDAKAILPILIGRYKKYHLSSDGFIEQKKYEKGFAKYYQENLLPLVKEFEERRLKRLGQARIFLLLSFPGAIGIITGVVYYYKFYAPSDLDQDYFTPAVLLALSLFYFALWPLRKYKARIKGKIFPKVFNFFGDFKYNSKCSGGRLEVLEDSQILPNYNRLFCEDEVVGCYKNVAIDFFETRLTRVNGHGKSRGTQYLFTGVMVLFDVKKNFKGKTIIVQDHGKIGNWLKKKFKALENVKLEDPRFEKMFEVYSSDQIEARYLLTTSFMERLLALGSLLKSSNIEASFFNDKLLIKFTTKGLKMFEPKTPLYPEDFVDDCRKCLKEIALMCSIIDVLKLDMDIGM